MPKIRLQWWVLGAKTGSLETCDYLLPRMCTCWREAGLGWFLGVPVTGAESDWWRQQRLLGASEARRQTMWLTESLFGDLHVTWARAGIPTKPVLVALCCGSEWGICPHLWLGKACERIPMWTCRAGLYFSVFLLPFLFIRVCLGLFFGSEREVSTRANQRSG